MSDTPAPSTNSESGTTSGTGVLDQIVSAATFIASVFRKIFPHTGIGFGFAVIATLGPLFEQARAFWTTLFDKIDQLAVTSFGDASFQPLGFANYLLPLDWLCTQLVIWFGVYALCAVIRIIKSFIPTVS